MTIGLDLGSNTLRVVLMDFEFNVINSDEFVVGSARNLKPGGKLDQSAKERISLALENITNKYNFTAYKHIAVATEAIRIANDGELFLDEIYLKFGIKFNIIDPIKEAKFIELAVKTKLKSINIEPKNSLLIDLGGASTEISFNEHYQSFKFGIVRFRNEFENFTTQDAKFMTRKAREFISNLNPNNVVLTSSIPTNLAMLKYDIKESNLVNGKVLKFSDFAFYKDMILNSSDAENEAILGKDRSNLVVAGITLLESFLDKFSEFIVIDDGLREGIVINEILKQKV